MIMSKAYSIFTVCLTVHVMLTVSRLCEDVTSVDCWKEDKEHSICLNSWESAKKCPRYCGLCKDDENSTSIEPVTKKHLCVDLDASCEDLQNKSHLCDEFQLVRKQCPKSCHLCLPVGIRHCVDADPSCVTFINSSFCYSNTLVRDMCPYSCGFCTNVTSAVTEFSSSSVTSNPVTMSETSNTINNSETSSSTTMTSLTTEQTSTHSTNLNTTSETTTLTLPTVKSTIKLSTLKSSTIKLSTIKSTIKSPPYLGPLTCRTCEDPFCDMGIEADHHCPVHAPFCMNIIGRDNHNIPSLTKRCASTSQCEEMWLNESALNSQCLNLNLNSAPEVPYHCVFCCTTSECNFPAIPRMETLYRGDTAS